MSRFADVQYQGVGGLTPGRSVLDLSHAYTADAFFGQLMPIVAEECVPGDVIRFSADAIMRMNPSIVPYMHEVNLVLHCFFEPYRLTWPKVDQTGDDWESYIVGPTWDPETGQFVENSAVLPVWDYSAPANYAHHSLYDYFGFQPEVVPAVGSRPHALWMRAYNDIFNNWYRDEDLVPLVDLDAQVTTLYNSALEKDYFTSARPFQQKGIAPAIPVQGIGSAVFNADPRLYWHAGGGEIQMNKHNPTGSSISDPWFSDPSLVAGFGGVRTHDSTNIPPGDVNDFVFVDRAQLNNNSIDFGDANTINIAQLRFVVQLQKYLERNARAGNRYVEWLREGFGVSPSDARLQRPEYLGGAKFPVIVSEVLQTSATVSGGTPQGTMAGHGITVGRNGIVNGYRVEEYGVFMVIARVLPRTMYTQGVHRRAIRNSPQEFYRPEFAHLAEQAVTKGEIFVDGVHDSEVFGFQARYQEYRTRNSVAVGALRTSLKQWNLGREFSDQPGLTEDFITVTDSQRTQWMTRAFAVTSQAPFIMEVGNRLVMSRPMPGLPEPGLMDHF